MFEEPNGDKSSQALDFYLRSSLSSNSHDLPPLTTCELDGETLQLLGDAIPTLCWVANGDGYIAWYNRRWHDYCGSTPEEMQGWGWQSVHDPDVLPAVMERWQASIATGEPFEMTFPLRGTDGVYRPFLTRVSPVRDRSGRIARWFGINTDVSEQIAAEEAAVALLYEVNHRVKNSLQIVTSLLALQEKSAASGEVRESLSDARARISVVASIHQALYKTGSHGDLDISEYLPQLAQEVIGLSRGQASIELIQECRSSARLSIKDAVPLALIVSELLTNCMKYAFVDRLSGAVRLLITEQAGALRIEVQDDGCGLPADFDPARSGGMGMRVIQALVKQLRADFDYSSEGSGARFVLTMPLR